MEQLPNSEVNTTTSSSTNNDSTKIVVIHCKIHVESPNGQKLKDINLPHEEVCARIRGLLRASAEVCHYTNYNFELVQGKSRRIVQDWETIASLAEELSKSGSKLKMIPGKYNLQSVKQHIANFQDILKSPPMSIEPTPAQMQAASVSLQQKEEKESETLAISSTSTNSSSGVLDVKKEALKLKEIQSQLLSVVIPGDLTALEPLGKTAKDLFLNVDDYSVLESHDDILSSSQPPKCLQSISFSGWNPPSNQRKLSGDVAYLEVVALDGKVLHITCSTSGFYVNQTHNDKFSPLPIRKDAGFSVSVVDTLKHACPGFKKAFDRLIAYTQNKTLMTMKSSFLNEYDLASLQSGTQKIADNQRNFWCLLSKEVSLPSFDKDRAVNSLHDSFGLGERGAIRDWNEEIQSCMELPRNSFDDRIVRAKELTRVLDEFVHSAKLGAVAVISGQIEPMNISDPASSRVFAYNNIFFSFASRDLPIPSSSSSSSSSSRTATISSSGGPAEDYESDPTLLLTSISTTNHDLRNIREINSAMDALPSYDITPDMSLQDAINKASSERLHTIPTVVVDYLGQRVIAQAIIPGILRLDQSRSLKYGSVTHGKTILFDPICDELVRNVSKNMHLGPSVVHPFSNPSETVTLHAPVEVKGILASDGRYYILDVARMTPIDTRYYNKQQESIAVDVRPGCYTPMLRPELIKAYASSLDLKYRQEKEASEVEVLKKFAEKKGKVLEEAVKSITEEERTELQAQFLANAPKPPSPFYVDPNMNTQYLVEKNTESALVLKEIMSFFQEIISTLTAELRRGPPASGVDLVEAFHSNGVNLRYMGEIANSITISSANDECLVRVLENEMICRCVKHIARDHLQDENLRSIPIAYYVSLMNTTLSICTSPSSASTAVNATIAESSSSTSSTAKVNGKSSSSKKNVATTSTTTLVAAAASLSSSTEDSVDDVPAINAELVASKFVKDAKSFWLRIRSEVKERFMGYELRIFDGKNENRLSAIPMLRRLCEQLGLQIIARNYSSRLPIQVKPEDIIASLPIVKSSYVSPLPEILAMLEVAQQYQNAGNPANSISVANEASSLILLSYGQLSRLSVRCSTLMAQCAASIESTQELALKEYQRALSLLILQGERDSAEAARLYMSIGLTMLSSQNPTLKRKGFQYLRRSVFLFDLMVAEHPITSVIKTVISNELSQIK